MTSAIINPFNKHFVLHSTISFTNVLHNINGSKVNPDLPNNASLVLNLQ